MRKTQAHKILERVSKEVGEGVLIISKRGVPYLWFNESKESYSVAYFKKTCTFGVFENCRRKGNKRIRTFHSISETVEFFAE